MNRKILIMAPKINLAEMCFLGLVENMPQAVRDSLEYDKAMKTAKFNNGDRYYLRDDRSENLYGYRFTRIYISTRSDIKTKDMVPYFLDIECDDPGIIWF